LEEFGEKFKADRTLTLILRLRHNVIKTGVRRMSLAYSRISLADIADHLALDGPEDAEFIVAKAVRDGVIDAQLDHKAGNVASYNAKDTYASRDPERAFDKRIKVRKILKQIISTITFSSAIICTRSQSKQCASLQKATTIP